jgi:lysophospholipase L1-like esterase
MLDLSINGSRFRHAAFALAVFALPACAPRAELASASIPAGSKYVSMGSSFASGPGITTTANARCRRSQDNYGHQLARRRNLVLVDVSCGGATTSHILGPRDELPPQIDALTPDTRLVTITIGGNDLGLMVGLIAASCEGEAAAGTLSATCRGLLTRLPNGFAVPVPDEAAWARVESAMDEIAREVRRRAPQARLLIVDRFRVLPPSGTCAEVPLSEAAAARYRAMADRLAQIDVAVAKRAGAEIVKVSDLSRDHSACAKDPWLTGFNIPPGSRPDLTPYHPNLAGMTAIAAAIDAQLGK